MPKFFKFWLGLTALFLGLIATDTLPFLRGGAGWQWAYTTPERMTAVWLLGGAVLAYIGGVFVLRRLPIPIKLVWVMLGTVLLTYLALNSEDDSAFLLFTRTVSPVQTGASTIAVRSMAEDGVYPTLHEWTDVMEESKPLNIIHFTTHPPGQVLMHYWMAQLFDNVEPLDPVAMDLREYQCSNAAVMDYTQGEILSAGWWGLLMPLWASLTAIPLYLTLTLLTGDKRRAFDLTAFWALIPSILVFSPTWNTVYPFLGILAFYCLLRGLLHQERAGIILAGVILGMTTMLTFTVAPLGLLFGLYIAGYGWWLSGKITPKERGRFIVIHEIGFALGILPIWVFFNIYSGTSPLDIFQTGIRNHRELVQRADDLVWIFLHLYDLFLFTGWAIVGGAVLGMGLAVRAWRRGEHTALNLLGMTLALTMVVIALSGSAQGETARLLTFYIPFLLVVLAIGIERVNDRINTPLLWALQGATVVVMASFIPVIPLDLNPPPTEPRQDVPSYDHLELLPLKVTFAPEVGEFKLDSYRYIADPAAQTISLEFRWAGVERTARPYQFRAIAKAENDIDGQIVAEPYLWYPQNGNYLTTCWQEGDAIRDVILLPVPPVSKPVRWTIEIQAVDARTGEILPARPVILGPINYP